VNTIRDAWLDFESKVIPAEAPAFQRVEMRRAFYAGATSVVLMHTGPIADASEAAGVAMIQGLIDECFAFASQVINEGTA
jgi:hypothetical protein